MKKRWVIEYKITADYINTYDGVNVTATVYANTKDEAIEKMMSEIRVKDIWIED